MSDERKLGLRLGLSEPCLLVHPRKRMLGEEEKEKGASWITRSALPWQVLDTAEPEMVPGRSEPCEPALAVNEGEDPGAKHTEVEEALPTGVVVQPPLQETDATCVSQDLLKALAAPTSELDLYELNSADMEAVLQQDELNQDLKRLNLAGIEALAYILMLKHGSLRRAFNWFDTHRKGKFSHVVWSTGMVLLRIDLETLTGMKPAQVFHLMDGNPVNGFVSRKEWNHFFEALEEGRLLELLEKVAKEQGTIAQRVKSRTDKLEAERPIRPQKPCEQPGPNERRRSRRLSVPVVPQLVCSAERSADEDARSKEEEDLFRKRAQRALGSLAEGDALTYANDTFTKWQTDDHKESVLSRGAGQPLLSERLLPEEKCDIIEADLGRSGTVALNPGARGDTKVCHLRNFADEAGDKLKKLKVVHALAAELDLTTLSEGFGRERRIVAYDLGDFAQNLRRIFLDIGPGESKAKGPRGALSENLSAAQRQLVPSELLATVGRWTATGIPASLKAQAAAPPLCNSRYILASQSGMAGSGVPSELALIYVRCWWTRAELASGRKVVDFGTNLSEQAKLNQEEQDKHDNDEISRARLLKVANLREFLAAAQAKMQALEDMASEAGLHFARRTSDGVTLVVSKSEIPPPGDVEVEDAAADARSVTAAPRQPPDVHKVHEKRQAADDCVDPAPPERDSQVSLITEVFEVYSTGQHRGQRTFLRFSDLREFAEDLREVLPEVRKNFHKFTGELENIYDDTQQLQCDMGDHSSKGLTLRFFQVFVQKVIRRLGPSIVGALGALVAQPAPPAEVAGASSETVSFEHLQEDLSAEVNDRQLEQLFGLLRCSHYKTKPSDLRCFLETPNVRWYVLRHNSHVVGLGIVGIEEPILDARTAEAVYLRQMKVPPQLMAQTIASEAGFSEGVSYRFARVMRLCVHPAVQRRGLGSHLLRQMMQELREEDVDAVGAMFGLTPWLLQLWMREQTRLVWVAHGSDPSSGHHSATVLSAVSSRCDDLIDRLQARLALQLPDLLRDPLRELDANTLSGILAALPAPSPGQDAQDLADVRSYAWGSRNLSCCRYALVRASLDALRSSFRLSERHSRVLMDMLQGREVNESILRQAVRQLPWLTSDLAEEKTVNLVALRFLKYRPNRMSSVHKFSDEQTGKAALQGDDDGDDDDAGDDAGDGDDDDGHDGDDHGDDGHDGLGFHVVRHEQTDIMFFVFVLQLLDICVRYLPFGESTFLSEQILRNRPRLRQEGEFRRLGRAVRFEAQQPAD
ncbi:tRNA(Met) cytidine acetyltransferase TmcA [Symbiodinium microadriaticum]|uniref:tRNA(Met) cytidine acetyltransferase TmcA n=1 Tax=Symbiodinium microadriaticum TaxID=2951 RepID=A0A1Q9C9I6_SYMMI|nr:tRNA(Met) cytidine acetyltransferase TmcA [Symbiodinium microadriaticum]